LQPPVRSEPNAGRLQAAPTNDFVWQALDTYFFESALGSFVFGLGSFGERALLVDPLRISLPERVGQG